MLLLVDARVTTARKRRMTQNPITTEASSLRKRFGERALTEARRLLEAATAARDHKAGIFYAEVCGILRD
jgi:hypothetical protein